MLLSTVGQKGNKSQRSKSRNFAAIANDCASNKIAATQSNRVLRRPGAVVLAFPPLLGAKSISEESSFILSAGRDRNNISCSMHRKRQLPIFSRNLNWDRPTIVRFDDRNAVSHELGEMRSVLMDGKPVCAVAMPQDVRRPRPA